MIRFQRSLAVLALVSICGLAGCQEDERICYDRISGDLEAVVDVANELGDRNVALAAAESGVTAAAIWIDDDRSICDYVTAGPYLQRN